jgi:uncharacterized protein (TIGR02001 family)
VVHHRRRRSSLTRPPRASAPLAAALIVAATLTPSLAAAEVGLGVAVASDDRFRGVSLSDGDPVASVNISYDASGGLYGGLSGLAIYQGGTGVRPLGFVANLGYAAHLNNGASWDVGVSDSEIDLTVEKRYAANYAEVYVGLSRGDFSAHLYYSPNYLTTQTQTLYAEADGAWRPARRWRLFAHVGALAPLQTCHGCGRVDVQAGVAREISHLTLSLAVSATDATPIYPPTYRQARAAATVSAAWFF